MDITATLADRARAGAALSIAELDTLAAADVLALGMLADECRRARCGATVTYGRVHETTGDGAAVPEQAGEVRITALPDTLDAALDGIRAARQAAGARLLTGYSLADIVDRAPAWGGLDAVLTALKAAGLDAISEAPVDRLAAAEVAVGACVRAGLPVRCVSVHAADRGGRSALVARVGALVEAHPSLQTFAPLPRVQSAAAPTTGYDDVRAVALARVALPGVARIQVDWAQYGPKLAQVALTCGANDVDRVSAVDDPSLGPRRTSVEDVRRNIVAAGFTPLERDAAR